MLCVVDLSLVNWVEKMCVGFSNSDDSLPHSLATTNLPRASLLFTSHPDFILRSVEHFVGERYTHCQDKSQIPVINNRSRQTNHQALGQSSKRSEETVVVETREFGDQVPGRTFQPKLSTLSRELSSSVQRKDTQPHTIFNHLHLLKPIHPASQDVRDHHGPPQMWSRGCQGSLSVLQGAEIVRG